MRSVQLHRELAGLSLATERLHAGSIAHWMMCCFSSPLISTLLASSRRVCV